MQLIEERVYLGLTVSESRVHDRHGREHGGRQADMARTVARSSCHETTTPMSEKTHGTW